MTTLNCRKLLLCNILLIGSCFTHYPSGSYVTSSIRSFFSNRLQSCETTNPCPFWIPQGHSKALHSHVSFCSNHFPLHSFSSHTHNCQQNYLSGSHHQLIGNSKRSNDSKEHYSHPTNFKSLTKISSRQCNRIHLFFHIIDFRQYHFCLKITIND